MKYTLALIIGILFRTLLFSQSEIKLEDANKHVGDSVKVCGKVASIRYVTNAENQPTFINMGAAYPNQLLTIVIWESQRKEFEKAPEDLFENKSICVTGRIEIFRGKPQIVIRKKEQIGME